MGLVGEVEALLRRVKSGARLTRFQREAISVVESSKRNLLVVAPTGAGKTMIGVAAVLKHGRGFYLAPLRSLMREKFLMFREMFEGWRVIITNRDYSVPRRLVKEADLRIMSPYKMLIYMDMLEPGDGVVVVDEIHKVGEDPEMEIAISLLHSRGFRIVGLSATVREEDVEKMCRWLDADPVVDRGARPVPLRFRRVRLDMVLGGYRVVDGAGLLPEGAMYSSHGEAVADLVYRVYRSDGEGGILVWVPTRSWANRLARKIAQRLPTTGEDLGGEVMGTGDHDRTLRETLRYGVAIHHGGLSSRNRELVEDLFHSKKIRVVVTCFTLSHGVNLPARYLVFATLKNWDSRFIDPSTFHQISGRAGRPGLDPEGHVIVVTVGELESHVYSELLSRGAARIRSKLHNPWTLAKLAAQTLALEGRLDGFHRILRHTYYAQEKGRASLEELRRLGEEAVDRVVAEYFTVTGDGRVEARDKARLYAARMALHPEEWKVYPALAGGDYDRAVALAVSAASEATGVRDYEAADAVRNYGFLAMLLGDWKTRELAEYTRVVLEAVAIYVRRLYGHGSEEFANASSIVDRFEWGGNPEVEKLAKVLRRDELRRVIRNMPELIADPTGVRLDQAIPAVLRLVFEFKKKIYMHRVYRIADAVATLLGEEDNAVLARQIAREAAEKLASSTGAELVHSYRRGASRGGVGARLPVQDKGA